MHLFTTNHFPFSLESCVLYNVNSYVQCYLYNSHDIIANLKKHLFPFQVPGFPLWYNVKYDEGDPIYTFKLLEDYRKGDIEIVV